MIKQTPIFFALLILLIYFLFDRNTIAFFRNNSSFSFFLTTLLPIAAILVIIQICIWVYLFFRQKYNPPKKSVVLLSILIFFITIFFSLIRQLEFKENSLQFNTKKTFSYKNKFKFQYPSYWKIHIMQEGSFPEIAYLLLGPDTNSDQFDSKNAIIKINIFPHTKKSLQSIVQSEFEYEKKQGLITVTRKKELSLATGLNAIWLEYNIFEFGSAVSVYCLLSSEKYLRIDYSTSTFLGLKSKNDFLEALNSLTAF